MRRKFLGVLTLVLVASFFAIPAGALSGMSVDLCVSETHFEFDVTVNDVESSELLVELNNVSSGHIQWITTTIDVNQATGAVTAFFGPEIFVSSGSARLTWQTPFSDVVLSSSPGSVGWDVHLSGAVAHGSSPFTSGETLGLAFARDHLDPFSDWRVFDVPITDCDAPPPTSTTTTTTPTSTTTTAPTSTTTAPASTTTVPSTTTTAEVGGVSTLPLTGSTTTNLGGTAAALLGGGALVVMLVALNRRLDEE